MTKSQARKKHGAYRASGGQMSFKAWCKARNITIDAPKTAAAGTVKAPRPQQVKLPWLIQRANRKPDSRGNLDALFRWHYMGASEYEFGALPKAVKVMRAIRSAYAVNEFAVDGCRAFVVSNSHIHDCVKATLRAAMDETLRTKERSDLYEGLTGGDSLSGADCWVALDAQTPFFIAKNKADAEAFLGAL